MSLIQELEQLITKTGSYQDRELLTRILEQLKKNNSASTWGFLDERKLTRM
jgi:ABC-type hemin transport system ATPase subunit